ncbi:MAG TPA: GtrA family protein [Nocardioidaceae bacterium]|nr:GtrA family protein [Nocardioidaceae bacterium]
MTLTTTLREPTSRPQQRAREFLAFVVVGGFGYLVDVGLFNLLRYAGDPGLLEHKPLTAKAISVSVATVVTYLGNRYWTWRHRAWSSTHREFAIFVVLNAIGMAIALVCLAVSHYLLGFTGPLADNLSANVVGLALGTAFRFWAYPRFVFRAMPVSTASADAP